MAGGREWRVQREVGCGEFPPFTTRHLSQRAELRLCLGFFSPPVWGWGPSRADASTQSRFGATEGCLDLI